MNNVPHQLKQPDNIHCLRHGDRTKAYVCSHLLNGTNLGFFSDQEDIQNPYPDAWCSTCEGIRQTHGGWNEKSEALIDVRLVCGDCYEEIKAKNILGTEGIEVVH